MPSTPIIPLDSADGVQLIHELQSSRGLTVLLGSAISAFEPTGIPTGWRITTALAAKLARGTVAPREIVRRLLCETAFEHVMERCPAPDRVRDVLADSFRSVAPNDVHRGFARLVASGTVRHLVTTNYDTGLEAAFVECAPSLELQLVRNETETSADIGARASVLFKIHGCATDALRHKMAFRLRDEAELPVWKRDTFAALAHDRPLLVAGYSGLDFEICSELSSLGAKSVFWLLYRPEEMTGNARRTVRECDGTFILGDIRRLVEMLENAPTGSCASAVSRVRPRVVRRIFAQLSVREVDIWRAALYGEIGCGLDAVAVGERLLASVTNAHERAIGLGLHARGLFHLGRYLDASAEYDRAITLLRSTGTASELREAMHGFVESSRCGGKLISASRGIRRIAKQAETLFDPEERLQSLADAALLSAVLWEPAYRFARRLSVQPLSKWLRARARRNLSISAIDAAKRGFWLQLQQVQMWADRYELTWETVYAGRIRPLPSDEGYGQLGYVVAQAMAYRRTPEAKASDANSLRRGIEFLSVLIAIGAHAEAWKIARLLSRKSAMMMSGIRRGCQYGPAARIIQAVMHD